MDLKTKISNESELAIILETSDQFSVRETKRIEPGKHTNISGWAGIELSKLGIKISYKVYPADRVDDRVNASFMPFKVYNSYEIKISCDAESGVHLNFVPAAANSYFSRISVVLWVKNLFSYT